MNSWTDFLKGVSNGNVPDLDIDIPAEKTAQAVPQKQQPQKTAMSKIRETAKQASALTKRLDTQRWLQTKLGFIDASSLQGAPMPGDGGGAPPPGDPSTMQGGAPPVDPSMMQGAMPPGDPSMMQGGAPPVDPAMMQGGAPPIDPSMMQPPADPSAGGAALTKEDVQQMINDAMSATVTGQQQSAAPAGAPTKGKDAQQQLLNKVLRMNELLNGLYNAMGLPVPLSVIDEKADTEAIMQQNGLAPDGSAAQSPDASAGEQKPGTIADNPMIREFQPMGKRGSSAIERLKISAARNHALYDYLNKINANNGNNQR
jgi:hypothetical protein